MYDPTVGRFISEDPTKFEAGDVNLYRYVGNHPTMATDPTGLAEQLSPPYGSGQPGLWYCDVPGSKTDGTRFSRAWGFGEDEMLFFKQGCIGLCSIRTGSYLNRKHPQHGEGVRCFSSLEDALAYQRELSERIAKDTEGKGGPRPTPVLFAIESKNDISQFCQYLDDDRREIDPKSLGEGDLEPYDFATAFQDSYDGGRIVYWERMPWGRTNNPDLNVHRTVGHTYRSVVYCVRVAVHPLRPHPITKPKIPFGN